MSAIVPLGSSSKKRKKEGWKNLKEEKEFAITSRCLRVSFKMLFVTSESNRPWPKKSAPFFMILFQVWHVKLASETKACMLKVPKLRIVYVLTWQVISSMFEHPLNSTSVPFFLTWAHILVQWLLFERHHSPQEYQSQSSVSILSMVVHMTGKSLKPMCKEFLRIRLDVVS